MNGHTLCRFGTRCIVTGLLAVLLLVAAQPARADVVTVLFTGFGSPFSGSGMEELHNTLTQRFADELPGWTYSGQGFEYTQRQQAYDYIKTFSNIEALFVIGHSFGGNSALQLAENFLAPDGIHVDLTFQIDSVDNFQGSPPDNALPANVLGGYNYYQISTGLLEPQGEQFVAGAININTEVLFGDTSITHTSIDNDPRLHNEIFNNIRAVVPEPSTMALAVIGVLALSGAWWRKRRGYR